MRTPAGWRVRTGRRNWPAGRGEHRGAPGGRVLRRRARQAGRGGSGPAGLAGRRTAGPAGQEHLARGGELPAGPAQHGGRASPALAPSGWTRRADLAAHGPPGLWRRPRPGCHHGRCCWQRSAWRHPAWQRRYGWREDDW